MTEAFKNKFNYAVLFTGCVAVLFIFFAENIQFIQYSRHHKIQLHEFTHMKFSNNFYQKNIQIKSNQSKRTRYLAPDTSLNNGSDITNPVSQNLNGYQVVDSRIFASPYSMNGAKKIFI